MKELSLAEEIPWSSTELYITILPVAAYWCAFLDFFRKGSYLTMVQEDFFKEYWTIILSKEGSGAQYKEPETARDRIR